MKKIILTIVLCFSAISFMSCSTIHERKEKEYGILESGIISAIDKVNGKYPDQLPGNFDSCDYLKIIKGNIPEDQYREIQRRRIVIVPKGWYYLAKVYNQDCEMILFDYSCDNYIDGKVWENPDKFDLDKLEQYDICK